MYDAGFPSDVSGLQRARGELRVRVAERGGASVLDRLFQAGCLKARFPRGAVRGWSDIVTLNTSGGIAGGDRLTSDVRDRGGRARDNRLAGGRALLPRPGRRRSGARAHARRGRRGRRGRVAAAGNDPVRRLCDRSPSRCRAVGLVRGLSGSRRWFSAAPRWASACGPDKFATRSGCAAPERLIWHDAVRLDGDIDALLRRPAVANGAGAVATLVHVAPEAEQRVDAVRAALDGDAGGERRQRLGRDAGRPVAGVRRRAVARGRDGGARSTAPGTAVAAGLAVLTGGSRRCT